MKDTSIRIFSPYMDLLHEVDGYSSFQFERAYYKPGSFELHINKHILSNDQVEKGSLVVLGNDTSKAGIIRQKEIKLDQNGEESEEWTLQGPSLQGLMNQRITVPPEGKSHDRKSGSAESVMKHYVRNNFIDVTDGARKINNLIIADDQERGNHIDYESRYKKVGEELEEISKKANIGWTVYLDYTRRAFIFDVVQGDDLTQNNDQGNNPVFFSPEFDTIKDQSFSDSIMDYVNMAYVGGQGEGEDRKIITVSNEEAEGLERFESFVDARDIGNDESTDDDEELSDEEIKEKMQERGQEELDDNDNELSLEAEILSPTTKDSYVKDANGELITKNNKPIRTEKRITPFVYEQDFDLGDMVSVYNRNWGITMTAPIIKVKEIHEPGGFRLEATFGKERADILTMIDKRFNKLEGVEKQEVPAQIVKEQTKDFDDKLTQEERERIEQAKENLEEAKKYAEPYIQMQDTEPSDTTRKWMDTSQEPNILKSYDSSKGKWTKATPSEADEIEYGEGETVEDMKPAQPGSDVTGDHTANDTEHVGGTPAEEVEDVTGSQEKADRAEQEAKRASVAQEEYNKAVKDIRNSLEKKAETGAYDGKIDSIMSDLADKAELKYVDGELKDKAEKSDTYTKKNLDNKFNNVVSVTKYETDQDGIVNRLDSNESSIKQNENEIQTKVSSTEYEKGIQEAKDHTDEELKNYVDKTLYNEDMKEIMDKVDGVIETHFYDHDPDMNSQPTSGWNQDEYNDHVGDLFYNTDNGHVFRFAKKNGEYSWLAVENTDIQKALKQASDAQYTANNKRRTFTEKPKAPYDEGDIWVTDSDILVAIKHRDDSFVKDDWKKKADVTSENTANDTDKVNGEKADQVITRISTAESNITQHDDEIKAKVEESTYEKDMNDVTTRVNEAESNITQNADQIKSKVEESDFNKAESRLTEAESNITQNADSIKSKVDESTFNDAESRLTEAESNITQNADSIKSKVSESKYEDDLNGKNGIKTRLSNNESNIEQNKNEISQKVSSSEFNDVKTRVNEAEQKIQDDAIISTVTSSESFLGDLTDTEKSAKDYAQEQADLLDKDISDLEDNLYDVETELEQTSEEFRFKFRQTGGVNLLQNSVGFSGTDFWEKTGDVTTTQSNELKIYGPGSGFVLNGEIRQHVKTDSGKYTLSFLVDKDKSATGTVRMEYDDNQVLKVDITDDEEDNFAEYEMTIDMNGTDLDIVFQGDEGSDIVLTNIMLNPGDAPDRWSNSSAEVYSANTIINSKGIKVKSNSGEGYTVITPEEFSGYDEVEGEMQRVFTLNNDTTEMTKTQVQDEIDMDTIKIIPVNSTGRKGWAFIRSES